MTEPSRAASRPVEIAFRVLETVAECQPVGVSEIARRLSLPKSTIQRALRSLEALRYVYSTGEVTRWSLTLRSLYLGARASSLDLRDAALSDMQRLFEATKEAVHVAVPETHHMVVLEKIDSVHAVRTHTDRGEYLPAHASAVGKAYLAALDSDDLEEFLSAPLARFTENTITDSEKLRTQLKRIRERGYSVNQGERRPDVYSIGAAIRGADGRPIAGLAISAPRQRLVGPTIDSTGKLVLQSAERISARLGWHPILDN